MPQAKNRADLIRQPDSETLRHCHFHSYRVLNPVAGPRSLNFKTGNGLSTVQRGFMLMGTVGVSQLHLAVFGGRVDQARIYCLFAIRRALKAYRILTTPFRKLRIRNFFQPIFDAEIFWFGRNRRVDRWVRDTMANVVTRATTIKALTVFTTNYLDRTPLGKDETLEDRIGVRLRSRTLRDVPHRFARRRRFHCTFDKLRRLRKNQKIVLYKLHESHE